MNTLTHHGVLGMKWGVRRAHTTPSADHVAVSALRKKKVHEMSNEELTRLTQRLQLEKSYKELTTKKISAGRKAVNDILGNIGKKFLTDFLTSATNKIAKDLLEIIKNRVK